ncbi:hypothetical protein HKD37_10G028651 [Glycine soja]
MKRRAKARVMSEIEEMKANMQAMKEQMTTMMEAMMNMRRMIKVITATIVAASTATEVDLTHPPGFNQVNHPASNMETHEVPRGHILDDFEPHLRYAIEGEAFFSVPPPNISEGPQYRPQPQPLHFVIRRVPPTMVHESFKEYTQRWRDLAAQVVPSMMDRVMITMIVDTLPVFYYEKVVGYMPSSFGDLVFAGKRIKVGLRRGKFDYSALMDRKSGENRENKKEGETHDVTIPQNLPATHPRPNTTLKTNQNTNQGRNFLEKKPAEFTPILVSYANLLPYLLNNAMVAIIPTKIPQPPFSR